jgi:F420-non-reducing hydrogenase iron-sulfur subunit
LTDGAARNAGVIMFVCNWNAYSALESAGRARLAYPACVFPVRVPCIGRLHPGIILKTFERGAAGVILVGCGADECHYGFGYRNAENSFLRSRALMKLLGLAENRLHLEYLGAGDGAAFVDKIRRFVDRLGSGGGRP